MEVPRYTADRNRTSELVKGNYDEALALARGIDHPWLRCQALAGVAEYARSPKERVEIISESFKAALEQAEPNRVVTVSVWPLSVMAKNATPEELEHELNRLARIISREPHPVRRCDALFMVATVLKQGPRPVFLKAVQLFAIHAHEGHGWKRDRDVRDLAVCLWQLGEHTFAQALAEEIDSPRVRRQAIRVML